MHKGLGHFDALAHALGIAADGAVFVLGHADGFDCLRGGGARVGAGQTAETGAGVDEIPAGHPFVEGILLGAKADVAIERWMVPDGLAENIYSALAGIKLAGGELQQG